MLVRLFVRGHIMGRKIGSIGVIYPKFLGPRGVGIRFPLMMVIVRVQIVITRIHAPLSSINVLLYKLRKLMSTITFSHKVVMTGTYRTWLIIHKLLMEVSM